MKAFHTIAIFHKDILEGRLTMDVFAAVLEQVCRNEGLMNVRTMYHMGREWKVKTDE